MTLGLLGRGLVATCLLSLCAPSAGAAVTTSFEHSTGSQARAGRPAAPKALSATLHAANVGLKWSTVAGADKYGVVVYPAGVQGPEKIRWVKSSKHYKRVSFKSLPTNGHGGFRMEVFAYTHKYGKSAYTNIRIAQFKKKVVRKKTYSEDSKSGLKAAEALAKDCAEDGLAVAVGTVVVGAPFVAFSVAIPGVGEITTGGLAAVAGVAGGGATVACFTSALLGGG
jgi:hypothetical protein